MKRTNTQQVQRILDGKHKKTQTYFMGSTKSKAQRIADIRRDKKDGDVWEEDGVQMTKDGMCFLSVKAKILADSRD